MKRVSPLALTFVALCCAVSSALSEELLIEETRVQSVEILDDSAVVHFEDAGWISTTTGVVARGGLPTVISLGDKIIANEREIIANIIEVSVVLKDFSGWGMELKAGDTSCLIVESEEDIPSDERADRLWIHVEKCRPIN